MGPEACSLFGRIRSAVRALRPRVVAQLHKTVADLNAQSREHRTALKHLTDETSAGQRAVQDALARIAQDVRALAAEQKDRAAATKQALAALTREVDALGLREAQLRAIARADLHMDKALAKLDKALAAPQEIGAHIRASIDRAVLHESPFPYMVADDVLPEPVFRALVTGLPPAVLFADKPVNHQHLDPPFELAPRYSRRIWGFMVDVIVNEFLQPLLLEKLKEPVAAWFRGHFPALEDDGPDNLRLKTSGGRILLRRRGYVIPPHRDPKWAVVTCLLYLPRPGDDERWGTQLFTVSDDEEARGAKPHWIDAARCTLVEEVAFRPNRLLVFVNAVGAHGASIPEDAEPADLERYAYQFRIGPDAPSIARLIGTLPDDRKAFWAGKVAADY
jgi:hypothetical protein